MSLPPWGSEVPWAFLPAASLPPPDYAAPLVRANEARTAPPRLGVRSLRVAAALAAAAVLALIAFERMPGQAKVLVNARDSRGSPGNRLEVFKGNVTPIAFDDGRADKTYAVTLEPISTATPVLALPTHDARAKHGLPAYPAPAAPGPKASPPRGEGGGTRRDGYLNINSIPASTCFLDGEPLGSTPRLRVSVSAGSHTVKFRGSDRGSTKTVVVNVGAGETRLAVTRLR